MNSCRLLALVLAMALVGACAGTRRGLSERALRACSPAPVTAAGFPAEVTVVLDGHVVGVDRPGVPKSPALQRQSKMPVDSIFNMEFITDSATLVGYGICPGRTAASVTSMAQARRLGLHAPPPSMCVRSVDSRNPPQLSLPVGERVPVAAGQLDILGECDRPPPVAVRWASSDEAVLEVDSAGTVRARAPGQAQVILTADGGEARLDVAVVAPIDRMVISPADTTITAGDTVTFLALAYARDGRPLPAVRLALSVSENRASSPAGDRAWVVTELFVPNRQGVPPMNTLRVVAGSAGSTWVRSAVVGRVDSVRVHVVGR